MKVNKKFADNFKKVCDHYNCQPDEVEDMKGWVRKDYQAMQNWFAGVVQEIEAGLV
jgi:hypothetical protein